MEKEALKRIFEFLEEKEDHNKPLKLKLIFNEPLTEEDLDVKVGLDLTNTNITSLPEGLKVSGFLSLRNTNITSLPKDLKVGGDLYLLNTPITFLPKGLEVGGYLDIRNTKITSLPKGLKVGATLFIEKTALLEYTNNELREMIKPGFIKGDIIR
jgi:hypothetical protein